MRKGPYTPLRDHRMLRYYRERLRTEMLNRPVDWETVKRLKREEEKYQKKVDRLNGRITKLKDSFGNTYTHYEV